jgi:hypothetical protein
MPLGSFTGTIVYGKNSKIVLKWAMDTVPAGDQP